MKFLQIIIIFSVLSALYSCTVKNDLSSKYDDKVFDKLFVSMEDELNEQYKSGKYRQFTDIDYTDTDTGVFVRVKINGVQRGCIGFYKGVGDVESAVKIAAVDAFFYDRRFVPIDKNELYDIEIQISICGKFEKMKNPKDFSPTDDIVMVTNNIKHAFMQGFIATENNYDKNEFITELEKKAGIRDWEKKIIKCDYYKAKLMTKSKYYKKFPSI
jgi:uncharacterized protein (TIGR00296 family)